MVIKYSNTGSGQNIIASQEDPSQLAAKRKKQALFMEKDYGDPNTPKGKFFQPVGRGATFAERGMVNPAQRQRPIQRAVVQGSPTRQLISREAGKKLGMGWQQRTALNKEILGGENSLRNTRARGVNQMNFAGATGRNQLLNTALTGQNQLAQTQVAQQGLDERNKNTIAAGNLRNQNNITGANQRSQNAITATNENAASTLAEKVRQHDQGRYDDFIKEATDPNNMGNLQTIGQANESWQRQEETQKYGDKVATRNANNRQVTAEIDEAEATMQDMNPDQRAQLIATLSPEAQANYEEELQGYQQRLNLRQSQADQEPPRRSLGNRISSFLNLDKLR